MTQNNRVVIAASGSGRTLVNLLSKADPLYVICGVMVSKPDCRSAEIALENDLPLLVANFSKDNKEKAIKTVDRFLNQVQANWIALAGFLKPFPVLAQFQNRTINIHPALLPKFGGKGMYGIKVHEAVIAAGETESGATIHFASEQYDEGPIIARVKVPVYPSDTAEVLAARVFQAECDLYPKVLDGLISNQLPLSSGFLDYVFTPK